MRCGALAILLVVASCGAPATDFTVHVEGRDVVLEGKAPLRGVLLDLAWESGLAVTGIEAGRDAGRANLVRSRTDEAGGAARVLLTDTRKLPLPVRGTIIHVDATGDGALTIRGAEGADDDGAPVAIEVR